jgi:proline racemase
MVEVTEPITRIVLDTAAGLIRLSVTVKDSVAKSVSFVNAPAFVMAEDAVVSTKWGDLHLDIAYGGNVYAILPASLVGLEVNRENASQIVLAGNELRQAINEQIIISHPELSFLNQVTHVEFYSHLEENRIRNAVVIPPGAIDRSPCGTGTSAKLAVLAQKGEIHKGESFIHESIIGSEFTCLYVEDAKVSGIQAVIPQITGSAYVTGIHTFMLDPEDPFPEGFELT